MNLVDGNVSEEKNNLTSLESDGQATEVEMRLLYINGIYFDTEEEMDEYIKREGLDSRRAYTMEYIRNYAGRSDVIKQIDFEGRYIYFNVSDEDSYGIYTRGISNRVGKLVWEIHEGSIEDMYAPFRERGIVFEDDVYCKIEKENARLLELCQKANYFNLGKQESSK